MHFVKGHGTENDFVILPDPDAALTLTPAQVARICDRRAGIGADGVLRVVRTKLVPEVADQAGDAEWFMDYRNSDGSVAEMCGNGTRVFARYLVEAGLAAPGSLNLATRAGVRRVSLGATGDVRVDMGKPRVYGTSRATVAGREYPGLHVSMGNPHLACVIGEPVDGLDLSVAPGYDASVYPEGVNVEFVAPLAEPRSVAMRVFERGSGETRSCGTGTVAAVVAAAHAAGEVSGEWRVAVPGGDLVVTLDEETSFLTGPAVLVADGEIRDSLFA
ncbi:diaminopimelate epimerase [Bailinhaonella thermotolerans]|uniref:Diaminopimelate epimerase n=1 Tax=Bailinhaonella thermotolerans TaxID=1070861 RepID=A0A3A4ADL9_9ACTN|nr:diaminopimelate epimerase [Bailinhaonella thermotolerans]RJL26521.1 diaminopimelate epimerase [Bailinhaonella thermotolerans]